VRYGIADMVFKKSILSYFLWIIYTVSTVTCLFAFAAYICFRMGYPARNGFAACLCLLLAEALACAFFHVVNKHRKNKGHYDNGNLKLSVAEGLTVIVILGIILVMRIISLSDASPQSTFFDQAMVRNGTGIEPSFQTSVYFFVKVLNFICFVFGNKITAGYVFQIVTQLAAFVMLYFAVRKVSGVLPALCAVLFPGMISNFNEAALILSTHSILFFIFALGLLTASVCFGRWGNHTAAWIITGVFTGFFTGVEIAMCVPAFVALGSNFILNGDRKAEKVFFNLIALLSGAAAGFACYTFFNSAVNGVGFGIALGEWAKLNGPGPLNITQLGYMPFLGYDNVAVLAVLCFGIFTFFLNDRSYGHGLWTFISAVLILIAVTENSHDECMEVMILYIVLSILAGIAVKNLIGTMIEERDGSGMFSAKSREEKKKNNDSGRRQGAVSAGTPGKTVTVNVDGKSRQIKLLDNPLALPKKREHKAMDYDIEVAEDDDYDIR